MATTPLVNAEAPPPETLPPEATYNSRQELLQSINSWAAIHGCAFITQRSNARPNGRLVVYYACDQSSRPPSLERKRQRRTSTRCTGCPFSLLAKEMADGTWTVCHRQGAQFSTHNHPPTPARAHPVHRTFTESEKNTIAALVATGTKSRDILATLREDGIMYFQQDVYNFIAKVRKELQKDQDPAQTSVQPHQENSSNHNES